MIVEEKVQEILLTNLSQKHPVREEQTKKY